MSLEDALINSGAQIARSVAEPWTPQFRRKQQAQKQKLEFDKNREQRAKETHELNKKNSELAIRGLNQRFDQAKTAEDRADLLYKQTQAGNIFAGVYNVLRTDKQNGARRAQEMLRQNAQPIYDSLNDDGDDRLKRAIESDDPKLAAEFISAIGPTVPQVLKHLNSLEKTSARQTGGSAFERSNQKAYDLGVITHDKYLANIKKFANTASGAETTAAQDNTQSRDDRKVMLQARVGAKKDQEYFTHMTRSFDTAIAALKSGGTALTDKMAIQTVSQAINTKIRAVQMYTEFDESYGNAAERMVESVSQWITGGRSPEQKDVIIESLENFRDKYAKPGEKRIRSHLRNLAIQDGQDPYDVVPITGLADLRAEINAGRLTKAEALKIAEDRNYGIQ